MKCPFISISSTLLFACLLLFVSCNKEEEEAVLDNGILEVGVELITPKTRSLLEKDQPVEIEAIFTPYGDDTKAGNIDIRYIDPSNGDEIDVIDSQTIEEEGPYHYTITTTSPYEKGGVNLDVCAYEMEIVSVADGYYEYPVFHRSCSFSKLFFQDKVGTDFQVKTHLEGFRFDKIFAQHEEVNIKYRYDIYQGDAGIMTIDILDEDQQLLTNLITTEITDADSGNIYYQFPETGDFYIRLKAALPDGSSENYWITKVTIY